jgi:hypothetical protein
VKLSTPDTQEILALQKKPVIISNENEIADQKRLDEEMFKLVEEIHRKKKRQADDAFE